MTTTPTNPLTHAHLRVARPTRNIAALLPFYTTGLGFRIQGSFAAHAGYSGVMLGHAALGYHLEFTEEEGVDPGPAPGRENLLVFYLPERGEWERAVGRMGDAGFESVASANPYWDADGKGRTFEDADGYRVVLWNGGWAAF